MQDSIGIHADIIEFILIENKTIELEMEKGTGLDSDEKCTLEPLPIQVIAVEVSGPF